MSKKDGLLTEGQVRQFMKLANLEPLSPGFIHGLTEKAAFKKGQETEVGGKADESPTKGQDKEGGGKADEDIEESHGRGKREGPAGHEKPDQNARLEEQEFGGEEELELGADAPLEGEEGLEALDVEEEPLEEPLEDLGGGRQVSVDDFLTALEVALEDVLGEEVEVEDEDVEELEGLEDVEELEGLEGLEAEEEPLELQEIINLVTKRVAQRVVKEALNKK